MAPTPTANQDTSKETNNFLLQSDNCTCSFDSDSQCTMRDLLLDDNSISAFPYCKSHRNPVSDDEQLFLLYDSNTQTKNTMIDMNLCNCTIVIFMMQTMTIVLVLFQVFF